VPAVWVVRSSHGGLGDLGYALYTFIKAHVGARINVTLQYFVAAHKLAHLHALVRALHGQWYSKSMEQDCGAVLKLMQMRNHF